MLNGCVCTISEDESHHATRALPPSCLTLPFSLLQDKTENIPWALFSKTLAPENRSASKKLDYTSELIQAFSSKRQSLSLR